MESEVRSRKSTGKAQLSPAKVSKKGKSEFDNSLDDDIVKLARLRDSGDGDSAPDTPPPEFADDAEMSKKSNITTAENTKSTATTSPSTPSKSTQHKLSNLTSRSTALPAEPRPAFNLSLDGMSLALFCLAFATRVWKLDTPKAVVFDELHYGKYAGLYMKNTFFFDSQPPLGKQLIALAAYVGGFDGEFQFERIGQPYDAIVPVAALRIVPAFFGSLLMPTVYSLMLEVGVSNYAGALAAILMIFDNAILAQSRFILLESIYMFFGIFGLLCIVKLRRFHNRQYSLPWFCCMALGIVSLTLSFCVRYFGLFTFFLGMVILTKDFWKLVGNRAVSDWQLLINFLVRATFVIAIPICIYLGVFAVHLSFLYKAGPNDNVMTSGFQASLEGGLAAIIANQPVQILHGSQVTLRHTQGRACWLHSHDVVYPVKYGDERGSSHQQQVTCYSYKDVNNWWIVKKPDMDELVVTEPHVPIQDGDVVQLVHGLTSRALNSHDVAAAVSPHNQEVSCYIDYNISMPAQNLWRVELLNKEETGGMWHAVASHVHLVHLNTSSALKFSGRQLPDWGFRQHEIVADKVVDQADTIWNVEEHRYSRTEDVKERERELQRQEMIPTERRNLTFWDKLYELQYKMLFNNQENVAGHMYASDPLDWLSLRRGVAYWISPDSNAQIHFLGNVLTWMCGTLSLALYGGLFLLYLLRRQRHCYDIPEAEWQRFQAMGEVFVFGFAIHYFPYFLVERTLFLHHYMPAYIFKVCVLVCIIDHIHFVLSKQLKSKSLSRIFVATVVVWLVGVVVVFTKFAPFTYGNVALSSEEIQQLTWRDSWDFIVHKE